MPIITIIIPSYKPGNYLYECIDSIVCQSIDKSQIEVIIVLNGCKEPWYSRTASYLKSKGCETYIRFIQIDMPGVSNARNVAINEAKGDYVTFIDDDDFVSATYLEELLRVSDRDTIGLSYELRFSEDDSTTQTESFTDEYKRKAGAGKQPYKKIKKFFSGPCMKLIHRDVIDNFRFDTRYANGEDSLFMFQISRNMKYVNFTSPNAVYYRRVRKGSAMSNEKQVSAMVKNRLRMMVSFIAIYLSAPTEYSFHFLITRLMGCFHSIINSIKSAMRTRRIAPPIPIKIYPSVYREIPWNISELIHPAAMPIAC